MPSLDLLRQRTQAYALDPDTSSTERAYAEGLLAEIEALLPGLAEIDRQITEGVKAKDEVFAELEKAKAYLRELNAKRDPISGKLNEKIRRLGELMGDTIIIGGGGG